MRVHVFIDTDGEATRSPEFAKPEVTLGRRPSNDVVLADAGASGSHARVFVTGSALTIVDLDSTNGTFVNQRRLRGPHVLSPQDVVEIGDTKLRFQLSGVESTSIESTPQAPPAPPSADGPAMDADWPAPPPMMDELGTNIAPAPEAPVAATAAKVETRAAVFPRLSRAPLPNRGTPPQPPPQPPSRPPSAPVAAPTSTTAAAFEFQDAEPEVLVNRVFEAVWRRVSSSVVANESGVRSKVAGMLSAALQSASSVRSLGDTSGLQARMLAEMLDDGPVTKLLEGQPDEVVFISAARARVSRGGHVSEGRGPFTCAYALVAWVRRVTGVTLSSSSVSARGVFGQYAVHAAYDPNGSIVSLRKRVPAGSATSEAMARAGVASPGMLALLSAAVASRMSVLVCAGPGARASWLMASLLAGGAAHELQVALLSPGSDVTPFPTNAVVMTRAGRAGHSIEAALGLGPDRLAVEDVEWSEAGVIGGLVSRSFSQILGVRAANAGAGLRHLRAMLAETADPAYAGNLTMRAVSLVVTLQHFSDGVDRITQLAEPTLDDAGRIGVQDVFSLVPGSRNWQFTGARPRCFEDIVQRGFPLDPSIFA
ncbi:MAG: FHA domain-containing protein [Nannocystaceae bacterium]|nr:FHA domain-containing protein [bacterium]